MRSEHERWKDSLRRSTSSRPVKGGLGRGLTGLSSMRSGSRGPKRRDELQSEGLQALNQSLFSTADRYREYRSETKSADSDTEKRDAWLRFLQDTARDRRIFRTTVFSKFLALSDD